MRALAPLPSSAPRLFAGLAMVAACSGIYGGEPPTLEWTVSHDIEEQIDTAVLVVPDHMGNVYMIGATGVSAGVEDIVIIKYDSGGVQQWIKLYDGVVTGGYDFPVDAVVDPAGNLYITGESESADGLVSPEWVTFKLAAADGANLWEHRFHGSGTFGFAVPRDMAIGPDGEVLVTGWSRNDDSFGDFGVVKYSPDGAELWSDEFTSPGFESDIAEAVAVGPDGSVMVAGVYVEDDDRVVGTVKYDSDGVFQWLRTFDASSVADLEDRVRSVAIDEAGNAYVAADGIDNFTDGRDFVLLKYAPDGTLLWDRRVIEPTADIFPVVLIEPGAGGNIYVSGSISNVDHRLVAFDPDGNQLWNRTHDGAITSQSERDHAALDSQGHVAVLVRTVPEPGVGAFTLIRYNSDGDLLDETTMDPEGSPRTPTGFATDTLGGYYATGWWFPTEDRDLLLYKLSTDAPPILGDLDGDGSVGFNDLLILLASWGACPAPPAECAADLDESGDVGFADLLIVLSSWTG